MPNRLIKLLTVSFSKVFWIIAILFVFLLVYSVPAFQEKKQSKTVLDQDNFTPLQKLRGDTLNSQRRKNDSPFLPGKIGEFYTPEQDSNYYKAMRLKMTSNARFSIDLKRFETNWTAQQELLTGSPLAIAARNMDLPSEYWRPSPEQIAMHEIDVVNSLSIPFIRTYNPAAGMHVSLSTIGQLLGLVEDVSPVLKYKIDNYTDVEVVVYSMQATVIATLFKGEQGPGSYKYTWNFRDSRGMRMPSGDYIGEIRIGNERYIRKRIYIP